MPKTKSQAEKKKARDLHNQEAEIKRTEEKAQRALAFRDKKPAENITAPPPLSKKELRQQKKKIKQAKPTSGAKGSSVEEKITTIALPTESLESTSFTDTDTPSAEVKAVEDEAPPKLIAPFTIPPLNPTSSYVSVILKTPRLRTSTTPHNVTTDLKIAREKASKDAKSTAVLPTKSARRVENHSTYCEGLKPLLIRLGKHLPRCTIIPGEISGGEHKYENIELRFQREVDENTYRFVARNGGTTQEVIISVPDAKLIPATQIIKYIESILSSTKSKSNSITRDEAVSYGSYNRSLHHETKGLWKTAHQAQHQTDKARTEESKKEMLIKKHSRTLVTKGLPAEAIASYAERDVGILTGETRSKHSLRK